jgi:hypothetical protein
VGTFPVHDIVTDARNHSASSTSQLQVIAGPRIDSFAATPSAVDVGSAVGFDARVSGGVPPFSYSYANLPVGCSPVSVPSFSCTFLSPGAHLVSLAVEDALGGVADGNATVWVNDLPNHAVLTVANHQLDVGDQLDLSTSVGGGTPPLRYLYSGLPTGCSSGDLQNLSCRPSAAGVFSTMEVTVTDALGAQAVSAAEFLEVQAGPVVAALNVTPSNITLGDAIEFAATIRGGTLPLIVTWGGLPTGCASSLLSFSCAPASPGEFMVTVNVTDARHHSSTASATLTVSGPPELGPPGRLTLAESIGVGLTVGILGVVAAWLLLRRRRTRGDSGGRPEGSRDR